MRLVAVSMVKNEADIIEQFVRHTLRFVDALFILENQSVDGTREILCDLQREGLPIVIFDDPVFRWLQSQKVTALARNVCEYTAPDFLFVLDADEFISAPSREALERDLRALPPGAHGLMPWQTYLYADESIDPDPIRRMTRRRRVERPAYYKAVIAAGAVNPQDLIVPAGNHDVRQIDRGDGSGQTVVSAPCYVLASAQLAHYPIRSEAQTVARALCGWLAYLAKDPDSAANDNGFQKRELYNRLVSNPHLSAEELAAESLNYAQQDVSRTVIDDETSVEEPLPVTYCRRHADHATREPLVTVARTMEAAFRPAFNVPFAKASPSASPDRQIFGAWDAQFHDANLCLDLPPFRYIADKFGPASVLDLGCGLGGYIRMFAEWGASEVRGVDGYPTSELFLSPSNYTSHDLSQPLALGRRYDLVVCTEVIEHIDEAYEDIALQTIARHASNVILFSAAQPNQPGIGHVNCKSLAHWLDRWRELGWEPAAFDSLAVRSLSTYSWFRKNLVVLMRAERAHASFPAFAPDDLERLAGQQWSWYGQERRIITHPFSRGVADAVPRCCDGLDDGGQ